MSYGVKYRNTYTDLLGVSHQVDILEEGYSGSITTVYATSDPVIFAWDPSDDTKYPTTIVSSMDINLRSPSRQYFRSLFTASKFKYQVKHYTAAAEDWIGFLIPDLYTEAYESKDFAVNLKATDGLGLLVNMDFVDANGDAYTGLKSDFDIIKIMLDKIGNERAIITAVNIFETTMANTDYDDPLKQAYTNCDIFYGMNCADVLAEILKPYGAILFQSKEGWFVVRFSQLKGEYTSIWHDSLGNVDSVESYSPTISLTDENATASARNVMVMGASSMQIIPAIKSLRINQDYGYNDNIIPGGNMPKKEFTYTWTDLGRNGYYRYVSDKWQLKIPLPNTVSPIIEGAVIDAKNNQLALKIEGIVDRSLLYGKANAKYAESSFPIVADDKKVIFSIEFAASATKSYSRPVVLANIPVDIYFRIKIGTQYRTDTGWTTDGTNVDSYLSIANYTANTGWTSKSFEIESVPESGTCTIQVLQMFYSYVGENVFDGTLLIKKIGMEFPEGDTNLEFDTIVNNENNFKPADIDIMCADLPDITNNKIIYSNGKYLGDGTPTVLWQEMFNNIQEPLVVSLARIITDQHLIPSVSYDALIRHAHCNIGSVITDPWDGCMYRVLSIRSYSVANCEMRCRLCEIMDHEGLLTEGGESILTETSETILTD